MAQTSEMVNEDLLSMTEELKNITVGIVQELDNNSKQLDRISNNIIKR